MFITLKNLIIYKFFFFHSQHGRMHQQERQEYQEMVRDVIQNEFHIMKAKLYCEQKIHYRHHDFHHLMMLMGMLVEV